MLVIILNFNIEHGHSENFNQKYLNGFFYLFLLDNAIIY